MKILIEYHKNDTDGVIYRTEALSWESAEEELGKLQRVVEKDEEALQDTIDF
jgi:hypothetical protein